MDKTARFPPKIEMRAIKNCVRYSPGCGLVLAHQQRIIRNVGGEIIELTPEQHQAFVAAVTPIYGEARTQYSSELLSLVSF